MALEKLLETHPDVVALKAKLMSFEELPRYKELYRARESVLGRLMDFCSDNAIFQWLTREFVRGLASHLRTLQTGKPILEICAGSGKLAYHLQKKGINIIATDNYSYKIPCDPTRVEKLGAVAAMQKYNPDVVLASWLPYESKIGIKVLEHPSVKHFVCIGEGQGGACGHDNIYDMVKPKYFPAIDKFSIGFMDFLGPKSVVQQFDKA